MKTTSSEIQVRQTAILDRALMEEAIMLYLEKYADADYEYLEDNGFKVDLKYGDAHIPHDFVVMYVEYPVLKPRFERSKLWLCGESTQMCCYDNKHDQAHDTCIFCRQPEERK